MDLSLPRTGDKNAYVHKKFGIVKLTNSSADSGIALTINSSSTAAATSALAPTLAPTSAVAAATASGTSKGEPLHYQLKRQLPSASKLTQPSSEQPYIAELPMGGDGGISAETVYHTPVKRMKCNYQSRRAIGSSAATSRLPAFTNENSTTKNINVAITGGAVFEINASVIKSVLKPTPIGTLELPAATTSNATSSAKQIATAAVLTSISDDKLRSICTYHTNMVRKFPKKERTANDQERRNKNTIACRKSRRFKKVEQIAAEQQCKQFELQQLGMHEEILRVTALLEQLEGLNGQVENHDDETEIDVVNVDGETSMVNVAGDMLGKLNIGPPTECLAFTIENILGNR